MNLGETVNATVTGFVHEAVTATEGQSPFISLLILLGLMAFLTSLIQAATRGLTLFVYFLGFIKWAYIKIKEKIRK